MINKFVGVGRMTRDPELRRTGAGQAVASFTIAINRQFTNHKGERQADFIPCVIWGKGAENTERYCHKGSLVGVDGRLQSRTYQDNNGNNRTVLEVVCDSVQFLETKNNAQTSEFAQNTQNDKYKQTAGLTHNDFNYNDSYDIIGDDIDDSDIQF